MQEGGSQASHSGRGSTCGDVDYDVQDEDDNVHAAKNDVQEEDNDVQEDDDNVHGADNNVQDGDENVDDNADDNQESSHSTVSSFY